MGLRSISISTVFGSGVLKYEITDIVFHKWLSCSHLQHSLSYVFIIYKESEFVK